MYLRNFPSNDIWLAEEMFVVDWILFNEKDRQASKKKIKQISTERIMRISMSSNWKNSRFWIIGRSKSKLSEIAQISMEIIFRCKDVFGKYDISSVNHWSPTMINQLWNID